MAPSLIELLSYTEEIETSMRVESHKSTACPKRLRRFRASALTVVIGYSLLVSAPAAEQEPAIPSPSQFFGFKMGEERRLAHWDQIVDYFQLVAQRSKRVAVDEVGKTTLGHPYILATISTPDTIDNLERYKAIQQKLANPRVTDEEEANTLARTGKVVVLIGANVHAPEIGTNQMMNDLVYQLATEDSAWVKHVLENTIVLLIPSQNPDGQRMVVDWYRRNVGTPFEGSPLPDLYHPYAGHDNNRDSFMLSQIETQHLNRVLYQEWFPEVYLDKHQMGSDSARIFVPPFKNPPNPNVDPLIWSEVNMLGQAIAAKLHESGKTGVIWGERYSAYWQGANNTNPWWHNMVGLLTETASTRLATSLNQQRVQPSGTGLAENQIDSIASTPLNTDISLPAPNDTQYRMNYPRPWFGGRWTLADIVEYETLSAQGLLESVANNRVLLKRNFYLMNSRSIERFSHGDPYAYVIPSAEKQHDGPAVVKLLHLLQAEAAQVHVATQPFVADGQRYNAGTYVLYLAQPFGRWIKDILEPQEYPDIRWPLSNPVADAPYDVTAWTLGMLLGVKTIRIDEPFSANLTQLTNAVPDLSGAVIGGVQDGTYVLSSTTNRSYIAINRLLASGAEVAWLREPLEIVNTDKSSKQTLEAGTWAIDHAEPSFIASLAEELGLTFELVALPNDSSTLPVQTPRLGIFEPWGGNRDSGWTRWVLDQHEFVYRHLRGDELSNPRNLRELDVLVLPEMTSSDIILGLHGPRIRPEYRGGIGMDGVRVLRNFIQDGGTVVTLGNSARFAVDYLRVPIADRVRNTSRQSFFAPGTIIRVNVDTNHPIGYGMQPEAHAMFVNNGSYVPTEDAQNTMTTIVRYPDSALPQSGWMIGAALLQGSAGVIEAPTGRGRVIAHTFRVQHRGQTSGTFKLLFNSIFYGSALAGQTPIEISQ